MKTETKSVIAVLAAELDVFGCPYCGYRSGFTPISCGGGAVWICGSEKCGKTCCVLAEGVTKSPIGLDDFYPELQAHPRRGIQSHGRPDKRPKNGEFFRSRGIGRDTTPGCFVCGGSHRLRHNIAAFVETKQAGERVVAMFDKGAQLGYRDFEPDRVQVYIGACNQHLPNLKKILKLTKDGIIMSERIAEARRSKK